MRDPESLVEDDNHDLAVIGRIAAALIGFAFILLFGIWLISLVLEDVISLFY